ncbi:MAG: hypothetical protein ACO1OB_13675 [Archangium sp.]
MTFSRLLVAAVVLASSLAAAQVSASCDLPRSVDKYQLLRRLSLDLRGKAPTYEEYAALDSGSGVPDATIRDWLAGDDFKLVMRRYHETLFWPNVTNVQLNNTNSQLQMLDTPAAYAIASTGKRRQFRGASDVDTTTLGKQCGDFEQTQFNAGGKFVPATAGIRTSVVNGVTVKQEGWRMVEPYWAPGTTVKVCAFDAMETESVTVSGNTIACNTPEGDARVECGCGPGLRYCYGPTAAVRTVVQNAMREQLGQMVDRVSVGGRPYTELITARNAPTNGVLMFWKKYLAPHLSYTRIVAEPDPNEAMPRSTFTDATWSVDDRGSNLHAGVLTTPVFLLRFQTNRGRANRARIDFECESFTPPSTLETPAANGCSDSSDDLTKRCTCRYCHRQLEPMAAHYGQFAEAGTTLMTNTTDFPRTRASCVNSTSAFCRRFFVTDDQADNPGALLPYQYADAQHADITAALASGPKGRATEIINNGVFARCTTKRLYANLMKRDLRVLGTDPEEAETLETLAEGFKTNGYKLPWLVEQIVSLPAYRRIR